MMQTRQMLLGCVAAGLCLSSTITGAVAQGVVIVDESSGADPAALGPQLMRLAWETVATDAGTGSRQSITVQVRGTDGWRVAWDIGNTYVGPIFHAGNSAPYFAIHVSDADTGRLVATDSSSQASGAFRMTVPPGRYQLRVFAHGNWTLQVQEHTPGAAE
jgi:hypothetical protein